MNIEDVLEIQLRELGATEMSLEREISELPGLIREAAHAGNDREADRLANRMKTARDELKSLQSSIRQLEARLYTSRQAKNRDRSR